MDVSKGWIVFLDVFGFSPLIKMEQHHLIHRKLLDCYDATRKVLYEKDNAHPDRYIHFYAFSDSICLFYSTKTGRSKQELLREVISDSREIMGIFMKRDLPLRGGMSFGEVSYDSNLLIGQLVVAAVHHEQSPLAPMLFLPFLELDGTDFTKNDYSTYDIVELKTGGLRAGILIEPFPREAFLKLVQRKSHEHLTSGDPDVALKWHKAVEYMKSIHENSKRDVL